MDGPSAVDATRVADTHTPAASNSTKTKKGPLSGPSVAQAEPAPKNRSDATSRAAKYSNELGAAFKAFIGRGCTNDRNMAVPAKNAIISGLGVDPKNYPPDQFHPDDRQVILVNDRLYRTHATDDLVCNSTLHAVLDNRRQEFVKSDLEQLNKAYGAARTADEKGKVLAGVEGQRALKNAAHWVVTPPSWEEGASG